MRYFVNRMQDLVPGSHIQIDKSYWKDVTKRIVDAIIKNFPSNFENCDGGLYVGCAGVAYALYYLAMSEPFADTKDGLLSKAKDYMDVALGHANDKKRNRDPVSAFLLGGAGVYVVGSLICDAVGQRNVAQDLRMKYQSISVACQPVNFFKNGSDELFVGRAGYICGALLLNKTYNQQVISQDSIFPLCNSMIQSGRQYARKHGSKSPLMYAYYDTEYLGAAHGLSSILQMLLSCPDFLKSDPSAEHDVRSSVDFMLSIMQPNGNIVPAMDEIKHRRPEDEELVHWCHGAPGVVYLFAKAYLYYKDGRYLDACLRCGELTWQRGLLRKGPGICHGVAGSGYVFLLLYRLTGNEQHLHRALRFAEFMQTEEFQKARTPDSPYSLYEGLAGTICFLTDLMQPQKAAFPFFDVFA